MMSDTPIETIDALFTDETAHETSSEADADIVSAPEPQRKQQDERPPNRRVRRAFARVGARMRDDIRDLGVHIGCGRPYVGPTHNRCSCTVKAVQATGSMSFLATHERGKHDV